jgi:hypothetical protein
MKIKLFNKHLLSILTVSILTFSSIISVQATTIPQNSNNIDRIAQMKTELNKNNKGKVVSNVEKYVEFTENTDVNGNIKVQSKEYNKASYLKQIKSEAVSDAAQLTTNSLLNTNTVVTPGPVRSWLKTSLQITGYGGTGYVDVDGFFQWLSAPFFKMKDAIALAHDSNCGFPNANIHCLIAFPQETVGGVLQDEEKYITESYTSSGYQSNSTAGGGFTFSLSGATAALDYFPYGYIHARAIKTNVLTTGSTVCFTYGHSQNGINVSPTISFPGGASVSVTSVGQIDAVNMSTFAQGF